MRHRWRQARAILPSAARYSWGVGDQAVVSLGTLAITVVVAREVSVSSFGAFSAALFVYFLALGFNRTLTSEPLMLRFTMASVPARQAATADACGLTLVFALVCSGLLTAAGITASGQLGQALLALGVALPGLLFQDTLRFSLFAAQRTRAAFSNDLLKTGLQVAVLAALTFGETVGVGWLVLAWGLAGGLAGLALAARDNVRPRPRRAKAWWTDHRDVAGRYFGDFAVDHGLRQMSVLMVGVVVGLEGLAAFRGAQTFLGPLTMLDLAVRAQVVPEGVRLYERSPARARRLFVMVAVGLSGAALALGLAGLLLPADLGRLLLGATWEEARPVIPPLAVLVAANGVVAGAVSGLRVLGEARAMLRIRLLASPAYFAGAVTGALLAGASGAAAGQALMTGLGAPLWWRGYQRAHGARQASVPTGPAQETRRGHGSAGTLHE